MVTERNKKTSHEIDQAILEELNKRPMTAQDIAKGISSNWKTVKEYLKELVDKNEVKEIIMTDKISYYQRTKGDTYFNIPLDEDKREKFKAVFLAVLNEYRINGKTPNKTQLAKSAVQVIRELNKGGEKLPTIWYLYGMVPLMVADLRQDYSTDYKIEVDNFDILVRNSVKKFIGKKTDEIQDIQYDGFNNELYRLKKDIIGRLSLNELDSKKISHSLNEFLVNLNSGDDVDIFDFVDNFRSLFVQFSFLNKLSDDEIKRELLLTFDSLWGFIAIHQSINSLMAYGYSKSMLMNFYLGPSIETKKYTAKEKFSNLESLYLSNISERSVEVNLSEEASGTAELFSEWA